MITLRYFCFTQHHAFLGIEIVAWECAELLQSFPSQTVITALYLCLCEHDWQQNWKVLSLNLFAFLMLQGNKNIWITNWFLWFAFTLLPSVCQNSTLRRSLFLFYFCCCTARSVMGLFPLLTPGLQTIYFSAFCLFVVFGFTFCTNCNTPRFVKVLLVEYISTLPPHVTHLSSVWLFVNYLLIMRYIVTLCKLFR